MFCLVVDLDTTDFGYAVGEVEAVVQRPDQVPAARAAIAEFLDTLLLRLYDNDDEEQDDENHDHGDGDQAPKAAAVGKLEYYLQTRRPDVYQIMVEAGVVPSASTRLESRDNVPQT